MTNTNFDDLMQCNPKARNAWRWAKSAGAMAVIVGVTFWCGATTGYLAGVANERDDGQREIGNLQKAYGLRLESLAGKTEAAAQAAISAADAAVGSTEAVEQAANDVQAAANQAQQAAATVSKAATAAQKAVKPVAAHSGNGAVTTEADNRAINRAVERANAQIKGAGP